MKKNAIVGQSGGPTAAINATLAGVIRKALQSDKIDRIYGMKNGIQGLLSGETAELGEIFKDGQKLKLLKNTPASAIGSCRQKLPENMNDPIYEKIFRILFSMDIEYFFYIGGNDSMDTVKKLSLYAKENGLGTKIVGVPKTIDNDLCGTDHTPGYGSAAKYIAATAQEICLDNAVYRTKSVVIIEIMGRDAGWLTAASALPRLYGEKAPDLLYLPECEFSNERFILDTEKKLKENPDITIAVSEGIKYAGGGYVCEAADTDIFGNKQLSGTAARLKHIVKENLGCKVRAIELNTPQRCASHISSLCDLDEAEKIGFEAVGAAQAGKSGIMMIYRRISSDPYKIKIGYENIDNIAQKTKTVPPEYINEEKNDVTYACLEYIAPLVRGEPKLLYQNGIQRFFKLWI